MDYRQASRTAPSSAVAFVNLHRRHLTESQRAAVAAKLANMVVGGKAANSANLQSLVSQADAAKLLNVSTRSVAAAAKVIHEGSEDLIHAVERGEVARLMLSIRQRARAGLNSVRPK